MTTDSDDPVDRISERIAQNRRKEKQAALAAERYAEEERVRREEYLLRIQRETEEALRPFREQHSRIVAVSAAFVDWCRRRGVPQPMNTRNVVVGREKRRVSFWRSEMVDIVNTETYPVERVFTLERWTAEHKVRRSAEVDAGERYTEYYYYDDVV